MEATSGNARQLGRRPVLDGLRGIAIVLVMLTHTGVLPNGYVGVDLFFALSGFLITTLLYEEWARSGTISLRRFYGRRARRLLPALGLMLLIAALVDALCYRMTGWSLGAKAVTSALFMNNWIAAGGHARALGSLNPTWSLAEEEQFYLLWPCMLLLLLRGRVRPEMVAMALVVAIAALLQIAPHPGAHFYSIYYSPLARAAELLAGCLAAVIWRHRLLRTPRPVARLLPPAVRELAGRSQLWRGLSASMLGYLFIRLLLDDALGTEQTYLRACLLAVLLIVNLVGAPSSLPARAIACRPLCYLGRISYGLYLFHLLTRDVVYHYFPNASVDLSALLTMAASIGLASASWALLESHVLGRRRPAIPASVAPRPSRVATGVLRRSLVGASSS